ncbi:hypothetical protein ABXT06_05755, partial [Flavobacterium sp. UW10123]|uniref:hypothetical protein n=1 Tax=Flavobacterium sp. UW10123 TaxID=3230800 RepID=UPI003391EC3B
MGEEIFEKKDQKKLAGKEKAFYLCTPQNTESSLRYWQRNENIEARRKLQNFFNFFLRETKRSFSFAPALKQKRKQ